MRVHADVHSVSQHNRIVGVEVPPKIDSLPAWQEIQYHMGLVSLPLGLPMPSVTLQRPGFYATCALAPFITLGTLDKLDPVWHQAFKG